MGDGLHVDPRGVFDDPSSHDGELDLYRGCRPRVCDHRDNAVYLLGRVRSYRGPLHVCGSERLDLSHDEAVEGKDRATGSGFGGVLVV